jgi:hypothetical protein
LIRGQMKPCQAGDAGDFLVGEGHKTGLFHLGSRPATFRA